MKLRKLALACAAIPAALFLTGCGSDDSTTSTNLQIYVNNVTSGSAIVPLDLYDVNGSSFTKTTALANLASATLADRTNALSTAGTDVGNSIAVFSSDESVPTSVQLTVYPVNSSGTLDNGVIATRTNALGGAAIYSTQFATPGIAIDADGADIPYVVLTNGFTDFEDGDVAVALVGGTQAAPTFAALSLQADATSGAGFGQVALQQNTAVKQPVAYMTSILPTGIANEFTSAITRCQFSLDVNGAPAVVGQCSDKTQLNSDIGDQTIDALTLDGTLITDVAGTAGGANMIAVAQTLVAGEIESSAILNCPTSNWSVNNQCDLLSIDFPVGTPGEQFIQVQTNVNRNQIVINVANNAGDEAAMVCDINSDGSEITGCVLPEDSDTNNIEIDLDLDKYSAI
jgi:hypothetical protein